MHLDFSIFSIPQPLVDWNTFYIGSLIFGENHSQTTSQHCCASGNLDTAGHFTNLSSFLHWIPILGDFSNIPKLFADSAYFLIVGSSFSFWICLSVDSVRLRNFSPIFSWSFWGRHILRKLFHPHFQWVVVGQDLTQGGAPVRSRSLLITPISLRVYGRYIIPKII